MKILVVNDGNDWIDIYFGKNNKYMIVIKKYFLGIKIHNTDKWN